ncbi:MAG: diacylglycerol kinase family protein [Actinomycetota bacterium]
MTVVVVVNPTAGRGHAGRQIGGVVADLHALGIEHDVRLAGSAADLEELTRAAAGDGADIVAVLGGDGTVGAAVNGLVGTRAALAVLPAGTGDDFAKAIGPGTLRAATRLLVAPDIREVDVVKVTAGAQERYYVNIAGAGFDSEVNETANAMSLKLGGTGTYVAAVLKTLRRFAPAHYAIELDDQHIDTEAMLVVVGNSRSYGGGMRVLPTAVIDDGVLDVCIVHALSTSAFLRAFPRVFRGTHVRHPKVSMLRATHVRVEANRSIQVYADGERVGSLPARFQIVPGALRLVVGPGATVVR